MAQYHSDTKRSRSPTGRDFGSFSGGVLLQNRGDLSYQTYMHWARVGGTFFSFPNTFFLVQDINLGARNEDYNGENPLLQFFMKFGIYLTGFSIFLEK